jgi:hypothetical protein
MGLNEMIAFLAVLLAIAGAVGTVLWLRSRQRWQSARLREGFGPEYDHALAEYGDQKRAERELAARERRVQKLEIRLLTPDERDRFGEAWSRVQQRFVDDPQASVSEADRLVKSVMSTRGYPIDDFEQRVADLSVDHAGVVQHYRAARMLAQANAAGRSTTEDLRQAMVHYRALFADLLETYPAAFPGAQEVRA